MINPDIPIPGLVVRPAVVGQIEAADIPFDAEQAMQFVDGIVEATAKTAEPRIYASDAALGGLARVLLAAHEMGYSLDKDAANRITHRTNQGQILDGMADRGVVLRDMASVQPIRGKGGKLPVVFRLSDTTPVDFFDYPPAWHTRKDMLGTIADRANSWVTDPSQWL